MNNLIAVTIGDINGIGIKLLIHIWKQKKFRKFVLFCNINIFKNYLRKHKIKLKINLVNNNYNYEKDSFNVYSFISNSKDKNTLKSLDVSHALCRNNKFIGVVTLPLRKDLIIKNLYKNFTGHTEYYQKLENKPHSNMMLIHKNLIVSTLTTHTQLKLVSKIISKKNYIKKRIESINQSLKIDFGIKKPKLLVSGLNPHAGENSTIGKEEEEAILPQLKYLKKNGIIVDGPVSADSMINEYNLKKYNCFIFMFHDQALIPFKYISKFSGVNYTANLDIIRTSPDHGTAYNLLNYDLNKVSNKSLVNCFKLIKKIKYNRTVYARAKEVFKPKFY